MDRIDFALRRFQQILPTTVTTWSEFPTRPIEVWLQDDVLPAIEGFLGRPSFQEQAAWPLRHLVPGAATPERRAVEAVDRALVTAAQTLDALAEDKAVQRTLDALFPPREEACDVSAEIGPEGVRTTRGTMVFDYLKLYRAQVRGIASRPWTDLVCPGDYLNPVGGLMLRSRPGGVTEAEFVIAWNPALHPVGDFVTRCLRQRVDTWTSCLDAFRGLCNQARRQAASADPTRIAAERKARQHLDARVVELKTLCLSGHAVSVRDSCVILTQLYLAFHPAPQLPWLGLPHDRITTFPAILRSRLLRSSTSEAVERIATALQDLKTLPQDKPARRAEIDRAIATGGLVLIDRPRVAYWDRKPLDVEWDRHLKDWEFLRLLATTARRADVVCETDLYPSVMSKSTMATRLNRLKNHLPPRFRAHIHTAGPREYRLALDRKLVHLFDAE